MHPSKALLVKKEIKKYLTASFIRPIDYSKWMANIILVTQPNGEIRICIDFRDISNAYPKDDFPLINIDMIIYSSAGHDTLSFMDGFLRYNQILINLVDQCKINFIAPWGNFCSMIMPFGLKKSRRNLSR